MKLNVSPSPHIRESISTKEIMLDVIIALLPTAFFGINNFGIRALFVIIVSIISAVLSEFVFNIITKRKQSIGDFSAVLTGFLIALNMPPSISLYIPVIASVFAIVVVKMIYGGLGQNFMNPALAGRCFVSISFAAQMNTFVYAGDNMPLDVISTATPLAQVDNHISVDLIKMFIGFIPGTIGEVSKIAIIIGLIYLLIKKVINIRIPLVYILSFTLFILIFSGHANDLNYVLAQVLGGGMLFGAVFMATDYVTSPITPLGQVLYAIFIGIMNAMFRLFGTTTEGCSFSILLGNLLVPFFDSITLRKAFGR